MYPQKLLVFIATIIMSSTGLNSSTHPGHQQPSSTTRGHCLLPWLAYTWSKSGQNGCHSHIQKSHERHLAHARGSSGHHPNADPSPLAWIIIHMVSYLQHAYTENILLYTPIKLIHVIDSNIHSILKDNHGLL